MKSRAFAPLLAVGLWASGCSDDAETPPAEGLLAAPAEGEGVQLSLAFDAEPGSEMVTCRHIVLPEGPLQVARIEHAYSEWAHHIIVYRTNLSAADVDDELFDCGDIAGPFVYASQLHAESSAYPEGVGMRFEGGEVLRVEVHHVNTSASRVAAEARLNLWYAPEELSVEAGSFFMYHRDILVPAAGSATVRMHCEIPEDIQVSFLAPHTHARGVAQRAWISGGNLVERREMLSSTGYGDLDTRHFSEPMSVAAGQAIDIECSYQNDGTAPIAEGPSKQGNEMCLLLGGYYPRLDAASEWCTGPGSGPVHTGAKTCGEALTCSATASDAIAAEACFVDVCEGSSDAINAVTNCGFNLCPEECFTAGPDCQQCVLENCGESFASCQAAGC